MIKLKVEKVDLYSNILEKEMSMLVYLPTTYNHLNSLPVLYFLHQRRGDENIMFEIDIHTTADKLIETGKIEPMIIVCPRMENSRGVNSSIVCKEIPDPVKSHRTIHLGRYEDYFIDEIIPFIDKTFKTINDRKGRYIGGASAGGYTALHNAFRHQDKFSKVGGHMPALLLELENEYKSFYRDMNDWEKYDPLYIAKHNDISSEMKVYLDAGEKDEGRFYEGGSILHNMLKKKGGIEKTPAGPAGVSWARTMPTAPSHSGQALYPGRLETGSPDTDSKSAPSPLHPAGAARSTAIRRKLEWPPNTAGASNNYFFGDHRGEECQ